MAKRAGRIFTAITPTRKSSSIGQGGRGRKIKISTFKKKVERDGIIQECRRRQYYIKPSQLRQKKMNDKKRKIQLQKIREAEAEIRRRQSSFF